MAECMVRQPRRILLIKPSSLGDIVHALPVLAGLRAAYPQAHIAWLVGNAFAPLLAGHPLLDEVIRFDRRRYGRMLQSRAVGAEFLRFVGDLRRRGFDLVVDLQGLLRSGFLSWASGARRRVGFAGARELAAAFYTQRVRCPTRDMHAVDKNLHLARTLGLPVDPPTFPLGLRDDEVAAFRRRLGPPFVALLPGARWETKRWRPDRWAELVDRLPGGGFPPVVLLGAPEDRAYTEAILAACTTPVINLVGQTSLRELSAGLALADLVICHDSGPMHIAAALDKPIVAIFGPTNPARTGPYCRWARVVALPLPCAPCYQRQCPLGHHNCMQQLDVDAVYRNVLELASRSPHAAVDARVGRG
jgi:heptosyltransferase-1